MRLTGTVKWFDDTKGFGFIRRHGEKDVFVHRSGIAAGSGDDRRTLTDGQTVEFEIGEGRNGKPAAVNVTPVAPSTP